MAGRARKNALFLVDQAFCLAMDFLRDYQGRRDKYRNINQNSIKSKHWEV
jgi:hypothetical protein